MKDEFYSNLQISSWEKYVCEDGGKEGEIQIGRDLCRKGRTELLAPFEEYYIF